MALTRDSIRDGFVQRLASASGGMRVLSVEELNTSRWAVLADADPGADVWVFAYGSLMWNPAFHYVERQAGTIHGYHRRFCLWTHLGRGDLATPGLLLGLDRGGSCRGVLFRVAAAAVESELEIIWRREMVSGAYVPRWIKVRSRWGLLRAIAFVINRAHERYAGLLPEQEVVARIAKASGELGSCADYLFRTAAHLDQLGIRDRTLHRLCDRVASTRAEICGTG